MVRHAVRALYRAYYAVGPRNIWDTDVLVTAAIVILVLWLWFAALIGRVSASKGQSFWYGFFLSLFAGPIIGLLFAAVLRPLKVTRRVSGRKRLPGAVEQGRAA